MGEAGGPAGAAGAAAGWAAASARPPPPPPPPPRPPPAARAGRARRVVRRVAHRARGLVLHVARARNPHGRTCVDRLLNLGGQGDVQAGDLHRLDPGGVEGGLRLREDDLLSLVEVRREVEDEEAALLHLAEGVEGGGDVLLADALLGLRGGREVLRAAALVA